MAHPSLDGVNLKLGRAQKHLHDAEVIIQKMAKAKCVVTTEKQPDGTSIFTLRIEANPPDDLSIIAGDFLCNVRAALDHLVAQLVVCNGGSATDNKTYFPICPSHPDFVKNGIPKLKGVSLNEIALIETLQPYRTGDTLNRLARLNNADKHHTLALTTLAATDTELIWWNDRFSTKIPQKWVWLENEELRDGYILNTHIPGNSPEVEVHMQTSLLVAFDNSWTRGKLSEWAVGPTLASILKFVKETVIPRFAPLFS
jgi:hypothetical protein